MTQITLHNIINMKQIFQIKFLIILDMILCYESHPITIFHFPFVLKLSSPILILFASKYCNIFPIGCFSTWKPDTSCDFKVDLRSYVGDFFYLSHLRLLKIEENKNAKISESRKI